MNPIALTAGEPAGIGPDIIIMLAQQRVMKNIVVIANRALLQQRAQLLKLPLTLVDAENHQQITQIQQIAVLDVAMTAPVQCGVASPQHAQYTLQCLDLAANGYFNNHFSAMVTGPINKESINLAGINFSGHTEYLAKITDTKRVVMMLLAGNLRVALATTHIPLAKVSDAIQQSELEITLAIIDRSLRDLFRIKNPCILVSGLNPHAGEGGYLGQEEIERITPAINNARANGIDCRGPYPADTLFTPRYLQHADAVLAMYHDQGLPVLKYAGFGNAVNITLGLPLIRTSVDHGTALNIAGTGQADPGSLQAALNLAEELIL